MTRDATGTTSAANSAATSTSTETPSATQPDLAADAIRLTRLRLESHPLPPVGNDDDKEQRGVVLVVGGSTSVPGAVVLSGTAALRAGAGKLQLATVRGAAMATGIALPEALVVALPVRGGEVDADAAGTLRTRVPRANATLVGPGMLNAQNANRLVTLVASHVAEDATLVLDGAAVIALRYKETALNRIAPWRTMRRIITPHAGEMAALLELPVEEVRANAPEVAQHCAERYHCVVVLKGSETWIAHPSAPLVHYRDGKAGLGTSGSGDVLAGVVAGLAARGADAQTAAMWGVWVHGSAGTRLSRSVGKVGFLARELLPEIPSFVND